jgi:hypothetical protein
MSVRIAIGKGGVFPPTTINQRDLVFWFNDDGEEHYPVPGCSDPATGFSLDVAPGATTPNYQPTPSPALPTTITYGCAIAGHGSESGIITVNSDAGGTAPGTPAGPTTKTIDISTGGVFATVDISQSNTVAWKNNDTQSHFPAPNCTGLLARPQAVTNAMQPAAPWGLPMAIAYGCAVPGHEAESGTINVYADLVPATVDLSKVSTAAIAKGGKSPYTMVDDPDYPYLSLEETPPAGSSAGVSIVVASRPAGASTINYQLNVTDAFGTNLNTAIQIKLS